MAKSKNPAKGAGEPTPINEAAQTPPVFQPTAEQRAAALAAQQRRLAEHAVLQQRFAEVEVEKCIAVAEREELIRVNQQLQGQLQAALTELDDFKHPTKPEPADKTPDEGNGDQEG